MRIAIYDIETDVLENIIASGSSLEGYNLDGKGTVYLPDEFDENRYDLVAGEIVLSEAKALAVLRRQRDAVLAACDYPPLFERPIEQQEAWREYRQALRDLPDNTDPLNPEWPTPPTFGK